MPRVQRAPAMRSSRNAGTSRKRNCATTSATRTAIGLRRRRGSEMGCVFRPKDRAIWWIRYRRAGKSYYESSESARKGDAVDLLRRREGKIAEGVPVTPKMGRLTFDDA